MQRKLTSYDTTIIFWMKVICISAVFSLMLIMVFWGRKSFVKPELGSVDFNIPVLAKEYPDPQALQAANTLSKRRISEETTVVLMKQSGDLLFGRAEDFFEPDKVGSRFVVSAEEGQFQVGKMLGIISQWFEEREAVSVKKNPPIKDGIVVLVPSAYLPVAVVAQTAAALKAYKDFDKVILASGVL